MAAPKATIDSARVAARIEGTRFLANAFRSWYTVLGGRARIGCDAR